MNSAETAAVTPLYLLLAGGKSRRMGGGDKNMIELGGRPMLAHVMARAVPDGANVLINANGDPARFASFGLPVLADVIDGFAGPLAGVLTGLEHAAATMPDVTHLVSLATDAPFLPADLGGRLIAAWGYDALFLAAALVTLVGALIFWLYFRAARWATDSAELERNAAG